MRDDTRKSRPIFEFFTIWHQQTLIENENKSGPGSGPLCLKKLPQIELFAAGIRSSGRCLSGIGLNFLGALIPAFPRRHVTLIKHLIHAAHHVGLRAARRKNAKGKKGYNPFHKDISSLARNEASCQKKVSLKPSLTVATTEKPPYPI